MKRTKKAALKSCKLGTNQGKNARPTNLVQLTKKVYGVEKRPKLCNINQWDCRPTSKRIFHPERKANLRNRLTQIQTTKTKAATCAVSSAISDNEKRKTTEAQSMLLRYGTSCFIQLLDDEPAPSENRLQQIRNERIARATAKRSHFQLKLSILTKAVNLDHNYCNSILATHYQVIGASAPQYLVRDLYEEHVCISPAEATRLEVETRNQSLSELWLEEQKLRITASIMKTVCHRKPQTNIISFITNKLAPKPINSPAINYGHKNKDVAIRCYVDYQRKRGIVLVVHKCGLWIDPSIPWLAATPDSILEVGQDKGCLEVKCPYLCAKKSIAQVSQESSSFCLQNDNGKLQLKRNHQYFYQIQTQLYVTRLLWCDFVIWTPDEIFVEKIHYDQKFIEEAILKAWIFYFDKFFPSIVPCMLIHDTNSHSTDSITSVMTETVKLHNYVCEENEIISKAPTSPIETFPTNEALAPGLQKVENDDSEDVAIVCVSTVRRPLPPPNLLQLLHHVQHKVYGDGNCLYHAIAHQAGFIEQNCHGDISVAKQLRILALHSMYKYPDVRTEDGSTLQQWEEKKMCILQSAEWGGDLELCLLAIAIGREIVVISGSGGNFTSARKFPSCPPPVPKMRGGIFIPIEIFKLLSEWKSYKPLPLLITYNGINHYDSTILI